MSNSQFSLIIHRNLTMNPLSSLSGNLTGLLPSLSIIDATGISDWTPEKKLFKLRMFRQINGLSLSTHAQCRNCNLYRDMCHNETRMLPRKRTVYRLCRAYHFTIRAEYLPLAQTLNNSHLDLSCYNECSKHFYTRTPVYHCWYIVRMASKVHGVFGCFAAVLNLVAFANIITSKQLLKSVSMCFVCNMAFSDCLMGIYIVAISTFQNSSLFQGFLVSEHAREICSRIGFLWMLSNTGSVITTLLLTLERYLTIVYSLRPEIRIPRRMSFVCLCICWFFAAFLGIFALQNDFYSSRANAFCLPTGLSLSPSNRGKLAFTLTNGILVLTFYLLSFTFYVHIYVAAKRTAQNAGVQRESKLAKKIALLVFTNMAFFFLPVLCIGIIFILEQQYYSIAVWSLVNLSPMLCVSINACCNPILHAFRHESFRKIVKARLVYLWRIVCRPLGLARVFEASIVTASYHHRTADDKAMDGENQRNDHR